MTNILERIVSHCDHLASAETRRIDGALKEIRDLASRNANVLTQILDDYIIQNEPDPAHRKNRIKGAKRMLDVL